MDDRRSPPRDPGGGSGRSRRGCEAGQEHDPSTVRALSLRSGPRGRGGDGWANGVARCRPGHRRRHGHGGGGGGPGRRLAPGSRLAPGRRWRGRPRRGPCGGPHARRGRFDLLRRGPSGRRRVWSRGRLGGDDGNGREHTRMHRPACRADDRRRRQRHWRPGLRDRFGRRWSRIGGKGCRRGRRGRGGRCGQLLDDRLRRGRRRRSRVGGQQAQRVDIALRLGGDPDSEMEVRSGRDPVGALAHGADDRALRHDRAAADAERAELEQRDRVAVRGLDRQRAAAARHGAGERDGAGRGRAHLGAHGRAEVDAAVLPARVGVGGEGERAQQWAVDRPGPGARDRSDGERRQHGRGGECSPHGRPPS